VCVCVCVCVYICEWECVSMDVLGFRGEVNMSER